MNTKAASPLAAFRDSLLRSPAAPLVHFRDRQLTLQQADGLSDGLAANLARRGIGRGRILGDDGVELPPGELGELAVGGPGLVLGYWEQKDQINASGYKIWPREVEDVLYEHEAVREAAVVGVADDYRGETVKAFVALHRPVEPAALISHCRERLAAYKVPRLVEIVPELPKTATGKILRRELRGRLGPP